MGTTIETKSYYELTGKKMSNVSQSKLFSILRDSEKIPFMNIWRTFTFNDDVTADVSYYNTYAVGDDDWWDNISANIYGTPHLWWVVCLMNDVMNPFEELEVGSNIKYLREEYLYMLFRDIERLSDLGG